MIKEVLVKSLKKTALELMLEHLEKDDVKRQDAENDVNQEGGNCEYYKSATADATFKAQFDTWYDEVDKKGSEDLKNLLDSLKDESGNTTTLLAMIQKLDEGEENTLENTKVAINDDGSSGEGSLQYCKKTADSTDKKGRPEKAELIIIGKPIYKGAQSTELSVGTSVYYNTNDDQDTYKLAKIKEINNQSNTYTLTDDDAGTEISNVSIDNIFLATDPKYPRLFIELTINKGFFDYKSQYIGLWMSEESTEADAAATAGYISSQEKKKTKTKEDGENVFTKAAEKVGKAAKKITSWLFELFSKKRGGSSGGGGSTGEQRLKNKKKIKEKEKKMKSKLKDFKKKIVVKDKMSEGDTDNLKQEIDKLDKLIKQLEKKQNNSPKKKTK